MDRRDQDWLNHLLDRTIDKYFSDMDRINDIRIEFGRRARRRLGSIAVDPNNSNISIIRINGWFRSMEVPEYIVQSVIVHELCHYAHGFNSGAGETTHRHPHAGGVIRKEFEERGLAKLYDAQQQWLKHNWPQFIMKNHARPLTAKRTTKKRLSMRALDVYCKRLR